MASIPIYRFDEDAFSLDLKRMEDIYDANKGAPDHPHRHAYYTVIWVRKGTGIHRIDFQEYELTPETVFFVSPGQVHQLQATTRPEGWVITFSKAFLHHHHISEDFIREINLFNRFDERPPLQLVDDTISEVEILLEGMHRMLLSNHPQKIAGISAYLKLFLIQCESACTLGRTNLHPTLAGQAILRSFKNLVEDKHHQWHKVSEYADALHITSRYLNQIVGNLLGQTAKEVIQEKITLNARRELAYSDKSIKEIAYELGFEDPLYFSSFFKKCTGQSPSAFRKEQQP
jgi:AraC family transcriptional activator of pobA